MEADFDATHPTDQDPLDAVLRTAEDAGMNALSKPELIGIAFDYVFQYLDAVMDESYDDNSTEGRVQQAEMVSTLAKDAIAAKRRCIADSLVSEYDVVATLVVPALMEMHGKRVIRANEQGQEQLGQRFKRSMRHDGNKRRTFGWYLRKLKKSKTNPEGGEKRVEVKETVVTTALSQNLVKTGIIQSSNHRIHQQGLMGQKQAKLKEDGGTLKRKHQNISSILKDPSHNDIVDHKRKNVLIVESAHDTV